MDTNFDRLKIKQDQIPALQTPIYERPNSLKINLEQPIHERPNFPKINLEQPIAYIDKRINTPYERDNIKATLLATYQQEAVKASIEANSYQKKAEEASLKANAYQIEANIAAEKAANYRKMASYASQQADYYRKMP